LEQKRNDENKNEILHSQETITPAEKRKPVRQADAHADERPSGRRPRSYSLRRDNRRLKSLCHGRSLPPSASNARSAPFDLRRRCRAIRYARAESLEYASEPAVRCR